MVFCFGHWSSLHNFVYFWHSVGMCQNSILPSVLMLIPTFVDGHLSEHDVFSSRPTWTLSIRNYTFILLILISCVLPQPHQDTPRPMTLINTLVGCNLSTCSGVIYPIRLMHYKTSYGRPRVILLGLYQGYPHEHTSFACCNLHFVLTYIFTFSASGLRLFDSSRACSLFWMLYPWLDSSTRSNVKVAY